MLPPEGSIWIQLCFIPHRPSVLFHPLLLSFPDLRYWVMDLIQGHRRSFWRSSGSVFSLCPFTATLSPHCWDPSPSACALQMLILVSDSAAYLQVRYENSLKNLPSSNLVGVGHLEVQCGYIGAGEEKIAGSFLGAMRKCWPQCQTLDLLQHTNSMPIN